jgi:hypothetical protein
MMNRQYNYAIISGTVVMLAAFVGLWLWST